VTTLLSCSVARASWHIWQLYAHMSRVSGAYPLGVVPEEPLESRPIREHHHFVSSEWLILRSGPRWQTESMNRAPMSYRDGNLSLFSVLKRYRRLIAGGPAENQDGWLPGSRYETFSSRLQGRGCWPRKSTSTEFLTASVSCFTISSLTDLGPLAGPTLAHSHGSRGCGTWRDGRAAVERRAEGGNSRATHPPSGICRARLGPPLGSVQ